PGGRAALAVGELPECGTGCLLGGPDRPGAGQLTGGLSPATGRHALRAHGGLVQLSRRTSSGRLSGRSPRQLGCRSRPSWVHSPNRTSPTTSGCTHTASLASGLGTGPVTGLPLVRSGSSR